MEKARPKWLRLCVRHVNALDPLAAGNFIFNGDMITVKEMFDYLNIREIDCLFCVVHK